MKTEYKRTIGQYTVTVDADNVSIVGNYNSNLGTVYSYGSGQPYGMEWGFGLTETVKAFISFALDRLQPVLFARSIYKEVTGAGLAPCFETGEHVIYFEPFEGGFNVGTACNVGILVDFHFPVDCVFSSDENLQAMVEVAEEYYTENE